MPQANPKQAGFTIVELMVSMSVLALMLFLINSIFNNTAAAVTTGIQTSRAIAATRVIDATLKRDSLEMVGPSIDASTPGGYIVIVQELRPETKMLNPESLGEFTAGGIRTDQLMYIRGAGGMRSMTPNNNGSYLSTLVGDDSGYAKIWYGHVLRAKNNGAKANYGLGDDDAGLDKIGSDWILGRQALLFNPIDELELRKQTPRPDPTVFGAPNNYIHSETARFDSPVLLPGGSGGFPGPNFAYMGVTDVTVQKYGPLSDPASLIYNLISPDVDIQKQNEYYVATANPALIPENRLHVNTSPDPASTLYRPWSIGQGHAILSPNCSEFIVQFAADLNGNGKIDTRYGGGVDDGTDMVDGQARGIFWYDSFTRNPANGAPYPPAVWKASTLTKAGTNGRTTDIPQPLMQSPYFVQTQGGGRRVFVFRADDGQPFTKEGEPTSAWPYMIRIRYRLHDSRGRMMSNDQTALNDGYDNDGDGQADGSDPENDEDRISGRWFERIITVPRPAPKQQP